MAAHRLLATSLHHHLLQQHPDDQQLSSYFFRLPPELRNRVYHLCASNYLDVAAGGTLLDPDSFLRDGHVTPVPALAQTCRRLAAEATAVLYSLARLRYLAVLGSTRVEVHAVGSFSPAAIHHLHLEIRPVCWQQACENLARLLPRLASLETVSIYLPRPMGWEQQQGDDAHHTPRETPSNQHHINGRYRISNNRGLLADTAWRTLKPILVAAQTAGLKSLELRGSYDRRVAKLAQAQLTLDVILGAQDHDYYITEEEDEEEEENEDDDDVDADGHGGDGNEEEIELEGVSQSITVGTIPQVVLHMLSSSERVASPLTSAIMIRRPPIVHSETDTHQGHP